MLASLHGIEILIVEDTLTQAMMIQHLLETEQMKVSLARSGAKALQMLESLTPQIILSDINMPEMSGFDLCKQVKSNEKFKNIPFVLLSTLVDASDLIRVIECGADDFIYKTFEDGYFLKRLQNIWSSRSSERQLAEESPQTVDLFVDGGTHQVEIRPQKLADFLVSAFEVAVFHNREHKI